MRFYNAAPATRRIAPPLRLPRPQGRPQHCRARAARASGALRCALPRHAQFKFTVGSDRCCSPLSRSAAPPSITMAASGLSSAAPPPRRRVALVTGARARARGTPASRQRGLGRPIAAGRPRRAAARRARRAARALTAAPRARRDHRARRVVPDGVSAVARLRSARCARASFAARPLARPACAPRHRCKRACCAGTPRRVR
jgi:hypothetical protein